MTKPKNKLPKSWKEIGIGKVMSVLPEDVQSQVEKTLLAFDGDYYGTTKQLKKLLKPQTEALLKIKMDPDFLSYALVYAVLPAMKCLTESARVKRNGH